MEGGASSSERETARKLLELTISRTRGEFPGIDDVDTRSGRDLEEAQAHWNYTHPKGRRWWVGLSEEEEQRILKHDPTVWNPEDGPVWLSGYSVTPEQRGSLLSD